MGPIAGWSPSVRGCSRQNPAFRWMMLFPLVRLDAAEIERDPGRLHRRGRHGLDVQARRLIWVRDAGAHKGFADAVKALAAAPLADAIGADRGRRPEEGRSTEKRGRSLAKTAIALPCYADDGRSIDAVIDDAMQKAGVSHGT